MADRDDIQPENVEGKYYVDEQCIDCDLCREEAPKNFTRQEEEGYSYVYKQPENEEEEAMKAQILKRMDSTPGWFTEVKNSLKGVSEETTTGVLRLHQM